MTETENRERGRRPLSPILGASLWMMGTLAAFMAMAMAGRELSAELNTFQILFWRSLVGLLVVATLLQKFGWHQAKSRQPVKQVVRNLAHFGGQYGWFYGVAHITIAQVFAIEFTVPIWTMVFAAIFLGERVTRTRILAVVLGFAGILVILRPGFAEINLAQIAVLGAALGYATANTMTKRLVATDTPLTVLFYMTLVQLPIALVTSLDGWVWPSIAMGPYIVVVGLSALAAHYCLARAFKLADATIVVPMDFMRVPLAAIIGYLVYAEVLEVWVGVGALIILAGNLLNVRAEARQADRAP